MAGISSRELIRFTTLIVFGMILSACGAWIPEETQVPLGNRQRGEQVFLDYGCGYCHNIPGVEGAEGTTAMPLDGWGDRNFIAGQFPNTPDNLIAWIQDPPGMLPGTAMPYLAVTEQDARDMSQYLFSLQRTDAPISAILSVQRFLEGIFVSPDPAPIDAEVLPPRRPFRGWEVYSRQCAECHDFGGQGLRGTVPEIIQHPLFEEQNQDQLLELILNGHDGAPPLEEVLLEGQIEALLEFLRSAWGSTRNQ